MLGISSYTIDENKDLNFFEKAIKEGKRKQYKSKVFIILTIASILLLIAFILFDFTNIDYILMDYFSADFVTEQEFDRLLYLSN